MTKMLTIDQAKQSKRSEMRSIIAVGIGGTVIGTAIGRLALSEVSRLLVWGIIGFVAGALIELGLQALCRSVQIGFLHSYERWLRRYGLACLWLLAIPICIAGGSEAQYWANAWFEQAQSYPIDGVFANMAMSGIIVLLLYLIIRPWSFHFSQNRLAVSLSIFLGGFFIVMGVMADPPGFQTAQMLWLLSVIMVLLTALILTIRMRRWR